MRYRERNNINLPREQIESHPNRVDFTLALSILDPHSTLYR